LTLARDVGGYQAGLTLYRQNLAGSWIRWFADAVTTSATASAEILTSVDELLVQWRERIVGVRADASARKLLEVLSAHPVVSTATGAELVGVSRRAATNAIEELASAGILTDAGTTADGPGRPERWWVATELLEMLGT
jgi:hypothetical protein